MSHHPFVDEHHVRGGPDDPMSSGTMLAFLGWCVIVVVLIYALLEVGAPS